MRLFLWQIALFAYYPIINIHYIVTYFTYKCQVIRTKRNIHFNNIIDNSRIFNSTHFFKAENTIKRLRFLKYSIIIGFEQFLNEVKYEKSRDFYRRSL